MFKIIKNGDDGFETVSMMHKDGLYCQILSGYGAAINSLKLKNAKGMPVEIIDGYQDKKSLDKATSLYKGVFLFPFPNRIRNGKYEFEKNTYQLDINEPLRNNALHGFLFNKRFQVQQIQSFRERALVAMVYEYDGSIHGYPFPADIYLEFELSYFDGLTCTTCITNKGHTAMPVGFGWHPYFATGSSVDEWIFSFPSAHRLIADEQMIPTGETADFTDFVMPNPLDDVHFDTGFRLKNPDGIQTFTVHDKVHDMEFMLWQEAGEHKFNYYQIYTPPSRRAIAIEPMTCPANAFNSGEGLCILKPEETVTARFGIKSLLS